VKRARLVLLAALAVLGAVAGSAHAQTVQLRSEQAPYYAGVPFDLQVVADGFEENPTPEVHFDAPPGSTLELRGVSPKVSSFMQIINGKVTRSKQVEFVFDLRFTARVPGHYSLGPFRVVQGAVARSTGRYDVKLSEIPVAGSQRIRLLVPKGPVYVGQRIPVRVQWWTDATLAEELVNQRALVPLFDRVDVFSFSDTPDPKAKFSMHFDMKSGQKELPAIATQYREKATTFIVRTVQRTMVPLKAGRFEIKPSTLIVDEAVSWRRDFFGMRTPTRIRTLRASDDTRTLVVLPLPGAGRPPSFAGAVGRGFTLKVGADRTVVRVGDPIKLTLSLRGDGDVEGASLPQLDDAGLAPDRFRVPEQAAAGVYEDGVKRFEVVVRAVAAGIKSIPPIAFSWFDPSTGRYQTTHSDPIALSVGEAQVVAAEDVYRAAETAPPKSAVRGQAGGESLSAGAEDAGDVLTGADLSIVSGVGRLLGDQQAWIYRRGVQLGLYAAGLLSLLLAGLVRRRSRVDPRRRLRRKQLSALAEGLRKMRRADEVSALLRKLRALADRADKKAVDGLLEELDELVYRPGEGGADVGSPLLARARELVAQALEEERNR